MPGTQAASRPLPGTMSRPSARKCAMVAPAGAGPWPQITSVRPRRASWRIKGTSPPGPLRCGSTTCKVNAVATAASKALPPFSRIAMPTAVAIQCVEATTPNVPSISGRVVNGLGSMLPITTVNCLLALLRAVYHRDHNKLVRVHDVADDDIRILDRLACAFKQTGAQIGAPAGDLAAPPPRQRGLFLFGQCEGVFGGGHLVCYGAP